jgi:hypothetical protein
MKLRSFFLVFLCFVAVFAAEIPAGERNGPEVLFRTYLDALKSGQWEEAEGCWVATDIEKSLRLGINYAGIPNKYDCASSLARTRENIRSGLVNVSLIDIEENDKGAKLFINLTTTADTTSFHYYSIKTDDGWRLSAPHHVLTRDWRVKSTLYARIYYTDASRVNSIACQSLDDFIESTGQVLALSQDDMSRLANQKIDYYLCDESQIKSLTGFETEGITDLPSDAVITRHLPHKHELTHLLINYALKNIPLYTTPFLQEGIACHLGGRWGRSPGVIAYTGYAVFKYELADLEDILTFNDFHYTIGSPDVSYPISALFVNYMIEEISMDNFKLIYRELSGTIHDIRGFSLDTVSSIIEKVWGKSWDDIESGFNLWWPQFAATGIMPISEEPGDIEPKMIHDNGGMIAILDQGSTIGFFVTLGDDRTAGFLLLKDPAQESDEGYVSYLFKQHLPDEGYGGERYGIRLSPDEIGLYDYLCNELVASFILSFSGNPDSLKIVSRNLENSLYSLSIAKSVLDINQDSDYEKRLITY